MIYNDRPWLVGEHNPYSNSQRFSLYPQPRTASGARLARIIGLDDAEYLAAFHRWNLVNGAPWSVRRARWAALGVAAVSGRAPVIMLGARVSEAFGFGNLDVFWTQSVDGKLFVRLPHPSGLCRAWNEPGAVDSARDLVRVALGAC